jgi:hypothetical protein
MRQFPLDHVGKKAFGLSKLADAEPQKECSHTDIGQQAGQVDLGLAVEKAPPKSVDYTTRGFSEYKMRHWSDTTLELKPTGKIYRPTCKYKWNNVAKISIFHIKSANSESRSRSSEKGPQSDDRQDDEPPASLRPVEKKVQLECAAQR